MEILDPRLCFRLVSTFYTVLVKAAWDDDCFILHIFKHRQFACLLRTAHPTVYRVGYALKRAIYTLRPA